MTSFTVLYTSEKLSGRADSSFSAFGSLGQYVGLVSANTVFFPSLEMLIFPGMLLKNDLVINVTMNDVKTLRINSTIQPNMQSGVRSCRIAVSGYC